MTCSGLFIVADKPLEVGAVGGLGRVKVDRKYCPMEGLGVTRADGNFPRMVQREGWGSPCSYTHTLNCIQP